MRLSSKKFKRNSIILLIVLLFLLIIIDMSIFTFISYKSKTKTESQSSGAMESYIVADVIDGDTFKTDNGSYVRLIGVNSPEKNESFYNESKDFLKLLILNKNITLEKDKDNTDNYGRLLRYAYVEYNGEIFINTELVRYGYAIPLAVEPNTKYKAEIEKAREECLKNKINLCS